MSKSAQATNRKRALIVSGVVGALVAIFVIVVVIVQAQRDTSGDAATAPTAPASSHMDTDGIPGQATGYGVLLGDPDATPKVVIYEDLQCPICMQLETLVGSKLHKAVAAGEISVEYRVISFLDHASSTKYSSRAANAAAAVLNAAGPEVWWTFHDLLFAHQPAEGTAGLTDDQLIDYAVKAGATRSGVEGAIRANTYAQWVINATDQASKDGLTGTPWVWIDGSPVEVTSLLTLLGLT